MVSCALRSCSSSKRMDKKELTGVTFHRYGVFIALRVLHTCSTVKIEKLLKEQDTVLSVSQVLSLLQKSEDVFKTYLNCLTDRCGKVFAEKNILNIVAIKRPGLFLELEKNNKIGSEKLTAAASFRLLTVAKNQVINDPHRYFKILNTRALVKSLGSEVRAFFKGIFPQKIEDLNPNCCCFQLLKHFPKQSRWALFTAVYRTVFPNKRIDEFLKLIDSSLIKLNPNREIIVKWAEINYRLTADNNFLKYYPPSISIRILKEKINVTSDMSGRQDLLKLLISTCAENKDMASLDKVLEYISSRHKNEEPNAYKRQIEFLLQSFKEDELTKNHWNFVHQQTIVIKTQGSVHFYDYKDIVTKLLEHLYKSDQSFFKIVLTDYLKDACNAHWGWNFKNEFENSKFQREIFIELCKLFSVIISTDNEHFIKIQQAFITDFVEICKKYPDHCINMLEYPNFVSAIEATCNKKDNISHHEILIIDAALAYNIICPQYALPFLNESKVLELFTAMNKMNHLFEPILVLISKKKSLSDFERKIMYFSLENFDLSDWFLRSIVTNLLSYHPKILLVNIEKIWVNINVNDFYKVIKHYSHMELDKMICNYLIKNWSQADLTQQEMTINTLLKLLPEDEFIHFYNKNLSVLKSTELNDEDQIKLHKIQCHVAGCLKDVVDPTKYLPMLLQFCTKEYLQFALSSLYSLFARSPENLLHPHIATLSKQNLAVQKHSIFLSCELQEHNYVISLLKNTNTSTHSMLKPLCLATLKYLVKTGCGDVFLLLKKYLSSIVTYNEKILSTLVKVTVPKKYRPEYIEICWKTLEQFDYQKYKVHKYLDKLLEQTFDGEIINSLSSTFVKNNIFRYMPIQGEHCLLNINRFTVLCLVYRESERQENYKLIFKILPNLTKKTISSFCNHFVEYQNDKKGSITFINDFVAHWRQTFSLVDALDEHIILNLLVMRINQTEDNHAKHIVDYLEQLLSELSPLVFDLFINTFKDQINKIKEVNVHHLFRLMLSYKPSPTICVLILQLLKPVNNEEDEQVKTSYRNVIETIKMIDEPVVQCYYEIYLSNNEVC